MNILKNRILLIALLFVFPLNKVNAQLQDTSNLIFLYMNGTAMDQDQAKDAYIINSAGEILHQWDNSDITASETSPGYLTPDGQFLRGIRSDYAEFGDFSVGKWGVVQFLDYDGNVLWEYDGCTDSEECLHHDIELLPSGNVLVSAFHRYDEELAAEDFGWNITGQEKLLIDIIYEIKPNFDDGSSEVVWQWKWVDHVIQDGDPTLPNYGVVAEHPEKINLHYYNSEEPFIPALIGTHSHINSIDYNPTRDEILISSGTYDEIYVIDHSTTTEEAASPTGGDRGKGGDILYRWGNPEAYDYGGGDIDTYALWGYTRTQHDSRWLMDGSGNITVHNNHSTTDPSPAGLNAWTQFFEINVPYTGDDYIYTPGAPFGPADPEILAEYDPSNPVLNSVFSGGGQKLDNDHIFTTSAAKFTLLEHDELGEIEWFFDMTDLHAGGGQVFKAQKYPKDYSGFDPLYTTTVKEVKLPTSPFNIWYNSANEEILIQHKFDKNTSISFQLLDVNGRIILNTSEHECVPGAFVRISTRDCISNGLYMLHLFSNDGSISKKLLLTH